MSCYASRGILENNAYVFHGRYYPAQEAFANMSTERIQCRFAADNICLYFYLLRYVLLRLFSGRAFPHWLIRDVKCADLLCCKDMVW